MNKTPLVSIGIVSYNAEQFIDLTIKSVLGSDYTNIEVIICDDCSNDKTWEIISKYKSTCIKAYRSKVNIGEYANRELCIQRASGDYFIFIDGDDYIYPHSISFLVKMMEAFKDCEIAVMHKPRIDIIYPFKMSPNTFIQGEFFGDNFKGIAFTNIFFRTDELKKHMPFPKKMVIGDDYLRYKICSQHNTLVINDSLTWWRISPNQASCNLKFNYKAIKNHLELKKNLLNGLTDKFSDSFIEEAEINYKIDTISIFKQLLKGKKIVLSIKFIKEFGLPLKYLFKRKVYKSLLPSSFSSVNPSIMMLDENPYFNSAR
jgi:glycosyltransferase involved in cell wall biosynthesis